MDNKPTPTMPPNEWKMADPLGYAAYEMAMLFRDNREEDGTITQEGYLWLQHTFGRVEPEDRASAFIQFLGHLEDMGLDYDKEEFNRDEFIVQGVPH